MESKDTYNFFVMGFGGAGKTTFLTSFYQSIGYQKANRCFHFEAPPKQKKKLIDNFIELDNGKWPRATKDITEWEFQCQLAGDQSQYQGIKIKYFDYAGGHLEDAEEEVADSVRTADSILCLLDGAKIGSYFSNFLMKQFAKSSKSRLSKDLEYLLGLLTLVSNQTPLQFAITKWDMLEPKLTLGQVRDELFKHKRFSSCIDNRKLAKTPCHLIPISSVGPQYMRFQWGEKDNDPTIQIRDDAVISPLNVEIPFFFGVLDVLKARHKKIRGEVTEAEGLAEKWKHPARHLKFTDNLKGAAGKGIKRVGDWFEWATPVTDSIGDSLLESYNRKCGELEEIADRHNHNHIEKKDEHDTHQKMLTHMEEDVRHFEREYPESNLSNRVQT